MAKSLSTYPVVNYATIEAALVEIAGAREFQTITWPEVNAPDAAGRTNEEWLCLLQRYLPKLFEVYSESRGDSVEGRARVAKYAALYANLALWFVQSSLGPVQLDRADALQNARADAGS